jgi:Zn finger protein HypA/HybF involved in hydrogenase expression
MNLNELQQNIQTLAFLEEADEPTINCYLNVDSKFRKTLNDQVRMLKTKIQPEFRASFWEVMGKIEVFLGTDIRPGSKGVAVFSRGGIRPFFISLQFGAPLPNRITISRTPHIYPLVELRDNCYRYVVLLSNEESAAILELDVGTITETFRIERPDLRRRVGREWTKDHYQSHSQARIQQFVNEQIRLLDQVMTSGSYKHLILAGDLRIVAQINKALPKHLSNMVISTVRASEKEKAAEIVAATLAAFEEYEEKESLSVVGRLGLEIGTNGAAVKGTAASIRVLRDGRARTLVLSQAYNPGLGSSCRACKELLTVQTHNVLCPRCGHSSFDGVDIKEEMVRLAEQNRCGIEIVKSNDAMSAFGGVGCLLRYLIPESDDKPAA